MDTEQEPVLVVFRTWRKSSGNEGTIALFPELTNIRNGMCESYERIGQHGGADYDGVITRTWPATEEEFLPLKRELEEYPFYYKLKVRLKRNGRQS